MEARVAMKNGPPIGNSGIQAAPLYPDQRKDCCLVEPNYFCTGSGDGGGGGSSTAIPHTRYVTAQQLGIKKLAGEKQNSTKHATILHAPSQEGIETTGIRGIVKAPQRQRRQDLQVFEAVHVPSYKKKPVLDNSEDWDTECNNHMDVESMREEEEESVLKTSLTHPNEFPQDVNTKKIIFQEEDNIVRPVSPYIHLADSFRNHHNANGRPDPHRFIRDSSLLDLDMDSEAQEDESRNGGEDEQSAQTDDDTLYTTNSLLSQMKKYSTKPQKRRSSNQIKKASAKPDKKQSNQENPAEKVVPLATQADSTRQHTRSRSGSGKTQPKKKLLSVKGLARILSITRT